MNHLYISDIETYIPEGAVLVPREMLSWGVIQRIEDEIYPIDCADEVYLYKDLIYMYHLYAKEYVVFCVVTL